MPIIGPDGTQHILTTDEVTNESRQHILECLQCQAFYPKVYLIVRREMADLSVPPRDFNNEGMTVKAEMNPPHPHDILTEIQAVDKKIYELQQLRSAHIEKYQSVMGGIHSHWDSVMNSDTPVTVPGPMPDRRY